MILDMEDAPALRAHDPADEDTDEFDAPVITDDDGEYDDDRRRGPWLTYRQHEAWSALNDRYPHAELVDGPAVRIGGLTARQYARDTIDDVDVPSLPVWSSALSWTPFVVVDLKPLEV